MACHQGPGSCMSMEKCLIVAVSDDMAIGRGGDMPWHLSEDLKYFKRVTMGCPVIMGRTTFESLGRPLPGRKNIVLSRREISLPEGVVRVGSLDEAYAAAGSAERCFIMGGASVYAQAIGDMDTLYITRIHTTVPDADTFFPPVDLSVWEEQSRSDTLTDERSGIRFEFVVYKRRV